jgi:hypothetical protein
MTNKLKPKRIEVDCVYVCPECGCETWYTVLELKYRKTLECICGVNTLLVPVRNINVQYIGDDDEKLNKSGEHEGPVIPVNDFVSALSRLGCQKTDAKKLIKQLQPKYNGNDGDFMKLLLQHRLTNATIDV